MGKIKRDRRERGRDGGRYREKDRRERGVRWVR